MRYHYIPLRMTEIITPNASEDMEKLDHSCFADIATLENSLPFPFKTKRDLPYDPTVALIYPREMKTCA